MPAITRNSSTRSRRGCPAMAAAPRMWTRCIPGWTASTNTVESSITLDATRTSACQTARSVDRRSQVQHIVSGQPPLAALPDATRRPSTGAAQYRSLNQPAAAFLPDLDNHRWPERWKVEEPICRRPIEAALAGGRELAAEPTGGELVDLCLRRQARRSRVWRRLCQSAGQQRGRQRCKESSHGWLAMASRNCWPKSSALRAPTPGTCSSADSVRGLALAISRRVLSWNTT